MSIVFDKAYLFEQGVDPWTFSAKKSDYINHIPKSFSSSHYSASLDVQAKKQTEPIEQNVPQCLSKAKLAPVLRLVFVLDVSKTPTNYLLFNVYRRTAVGSLETCLGQCWYYFSPTKGASRVPHEPEANAFRMTMKKKKECPKRNKNFKLTDHQGSTNGASWVSHEPEANAFRMERVTARDKNSAGLPPSKLLQAHGTVAVVFVFSLLVIIAAAATLSGLEVGRRQCYSS
ncbi:hypothetical protein RHGRI_018440 [Rhododendron griersonianum]|uniref:Uncharacterized protein n=1 Tax=Rhododendron griersonianum TaxID=479676 RepID=A0AAV6K1G0_9ERIC|nr:hypothetical protein RHGRI_018440 [Rhododendron griersonianum]